MKFALGFRCFFVFCFSFVCLQLFSQRKIIYKDTIIEEVVYEYDTIYIDKLEQKIEPISNPKSGLFFLPEESKLESSILIKRPITNSKYTFKTYMSFEISAFSTFYNFSKKSTINSITVIQDEKFFPTYSLDLGFEKERLNYVINIEYRQYSEVLQQTKPLNWKDTLDDGNEIYYRIIDGQLKSVIKNQYRFLQISNSVGYRLRASRFTITPNFIMGVGFNLPQKNFYLDTITNKIALLTSANKTNPFFILGFSSHVNYDVGNGYYLFIKPELEHLFIAPNAHPLKYRDIFGLSFGLIYFFKNCNN